MTRLVTATEESIREAAALLQAGKLVSFPTETVYGLGADATNGKAVAGIFEAKGRPQFNPLIVHVEDMITAETLVEFDERARQVAMSLWPGPLTLILPRRSDCKVSELCSAGLSTLAVRVPGHPVARALLEEAGLPIAAPSANISGTISPTTPAHVVKTLEGKVDMILAAGKCPVGLESTVLDLSGNEPLILRPGAVTQQDIEDVLGVPVAFDKGDHDTPRSPGQTLSHYAPSIPLRLNAVDLNPGEALLAFGSTKFMGIKGGGAAQDLPADMIRNLSESGDLVEAAANLFAMLHDLDQPDHKAIAVMNIPDQGLGRAINDRLERAASF